MPAWMQLNILSGLGANGHDDDQEKGDQFAVHDFPVNQKCSEPPQEVFNYRWIYALVRQQDDSYLPGNRQVDDALEKGIEILENDKILTIMFCLLLVGY